MAIVMSFREVWRFSTRLILRPHFGLALCLILGCRKHAPVHPTISVLEAGWMYPNDLPGTAREFQEFTSKTGFAIGPSPVPETLFSSLDPLPQLNLLRRVLRERDAAPDIVGIDVIWPEVLADDLLDLRPYYAKELSSEDSRLVSSYTVRGKIVAMPYHTRVGVLAYRADLLRKYGYSHPPETWDEMESMAAHIQTGERAAGRKNFWGYVWQGSATEGLTCNALEWQVSQGGGRIIEEDGTISVNNSAAIRSWERAARWIGTISPPAVLAYRETDTVNVWNAGDAAFMRGWVWGYSLTHPHESPLHESTDYTSMPGGRAGRYSVLGGYGLAVSRTSAHPREAIALIRFLISQDLEANASASRAKPDAESQLDHPPRTREAYAAPHEGSWRSGRLVSRPSVVAGPAYEGVTQAYLETIHSVLTGEAKAPAAASALEKRLVAMTGLKVGPPKT